MKKIITLFIVFSILYTFFINKSFGYSLGCSKYGMAYEDYNGYCQCIAGYVWGSLVGSPYCVTADQACRDQLGWGAESAGGGYCECSAGYMMDVNIFGEKECVSGLTYCMDHYGIHADYDYLTEGCECSNGYTLKNGICEEKENNVYFFLKELDEDNNEAIIYNNYSKGTFLITYGVGCLGIWRYENKLVVVNLGTDLTFDNWDKLVLQDDDETCSIISREVVDDTYTLKSSDTTSYTSNYYTNNTTSSTITNIELTNAIEWLYNNGLTSYNTVSTFMGNDYLTREQASKFFVMFANTLGQQATSMKTNSFTDTKNSNPNLYPFICVAYTLGIMNGVNNKFMPFNNLTQAQAIAMLIRITDGKLNEKGNKRYTEYYNQANSDGLLNGLGFNFDTLDTTNIKRSEVAILLYRAGNK